MLLVVKTTQWVKTNINAIHGGRVSTHKTWRYNNRKIYQTSLISIRVEMIMLRIVIGKSTAAAVAAVAVEIHRVPMLLWTNTDKKNK